MSVNAMNSDEALDLAAKVLDKANRHRDQLQSAWDDLGGLVRLVRAWARGEYRSVTWKTIGVVAAALLYFLNPFDAVPDFLPAIGLLDDASMIALVVASLRGEVQRFLDWEGAAIDV